MGITANDGTRNIQISSWNIHGYNSRNIGRKLSDPDFLEEIKNDTVVGIVETHIHAAILHELCIPGFQLLSHKNKPVNKKSKTSPGGMAFFIRESVSKLITNVGNNNDETMWLKIKKERSGEHEDIYIGLVYFNPSKSSKISEKKL